MNIKTKNQRNIASKYTSVRKTDTSNPYRSRKMKRKVLNTRTKKSQDKSLDQANKTKKKNSKQNTKIQDYISTQMTQTEASNTSNKSIISQNRMNNFSRQSSNRSIKSGTSSVRSFNSKSKKRNSNNKRNLIEGTQLDSKEPKKSLKFKNLKLDFKPRFSQGKTKKHEKIKIINMARDNIIFMATKGKSQKYRGILLSPKFNLKANV